MEEPTLEGNINGLIPPTMALMAAVIGIESHDLEN